MKPSKPTLTGYDMSMPPRETHFLPIEEKSQSPVASAAATTREVLVEKKRESNEVVYTEQDTQSTQSISSHSTSGSIRPLFRFVPFRGPLLLEMAKHVDLSKLTPVQEEISDAEAHYLQSQKLLSTITDEYTAVARMKMLPFGSIRKKLGR